MEMLRREQLQKLLGEKQILKLEVLTMSRKLANQVHTIHFQSQEVSGEDIAYVGWNAFEPGSKPAIFRRLPTGQYVWDHERLR